MLMKDVTPKRMRFSSTEIDHLWKSWLILSLAFAIVMTGGDMFSLSFFVSMGVSALTVGLGFIVHEMTHKLLAQRFRCLAEYRANFQMLFFAVLLSFFGFIFAAPGAVMIRGHLSRRENGIVSIGGPLSNMALSALFLFLGIFASTGIVFKIALFGYSINSWLALFNLLPFAMFDGRKVFAWSKKYYFMAVGLFFALRIAGLALLGL